MNNKSIDYFEHPAVSSSKLRVLLECPKKYYHLYEKCDVEQETSDAMTFGTALHMYVLEGVDTFNENYYVTPKVRRGTKAYKEVEEAAGEKIIIFDEDVERMSSIKNNIFENTILTQAFESGFSEYELFWTDKDTGIDCKAKLDFINDRGILIDLKTTRCASKRCFSKSMYEYKYYLQAAMYMEACHQNGIKAEKFLFVAIETKAPYLTALYSLEDYSLNRGYREMKEGLKNLKLYREQNIWPGHTHGQLESICLPEWAKKDDL